MMGNANVGPIKAKSRNLSRPLRKRCRRISGKADKSTTPYVASIRCPKNFNAETMIVSILTFKGRTIELG